MKVILGQRIPEITVGSVGPGLPETVSLRTILRQGLSIVIGMPGAFSPVCSKRHLPDLVSQADALKRSGFDRILCLGANDPFTLWPWVQQLDPEGALDYYADGNLEFCRHFGLTEEMPAELFMGTRSKRYLMVVRDGEIQRLDVEPNVMDYSCTRATGEIPLHVT